MEQCENGRWKVGWNRHFAIYKKLFQTSVISQVKTQHVSAFIAANQLSHTNAMKSPDRNSCYFNIEFWWGRDGCWIVEFGNSQHFYSSHSLYVESTTLIQYWLAFLVTALRCWQQYYLSTAKICLNEMRIG